MTDYSKMSDEEIKTQVVIAMGEKIGKPKNGRQLMAIDGEYLCASFDPCNKWADAGPIAEGNRISVRNRHEGDWLAVNEWGASHSYIDKNPFRAICIVFLMMNEGE